LKGGYYACRRNIAGLRARPRRATRPSLTPERSPCHRQRQYRVLLLRTCV